MLKERRTNPHSPKTYQAFQFALGLRVELLQFGIELRLVGQDMLCLKKFPEQYGNSNDEINDKEHNRIVEERSTDEEESCQRPEDSGKNCDRTYARF